MIHFFQHLNWCLILLYFLWVLLILFPKGAKNIMIGTLAFFAIFLFGAVLLFVTSKHSDKYVKDFIVNIHQQKSGDYTIVVKKHWTDIKGQKHLWFDD